MNEIENMIAGARGAADRWASVAVVSQARENADTDVEARMKWSSIYRLFAANGEQEQDEVFAAVNVYFLVNGCSPNGKYRKPIQMASGRTASSGEVVKITGKLEGEIRQFFRGRLHDSYLFLKNNAAVKNDEKLVSMAQNAGVPREMCWLLADWLGRDCEYFVGDESAIYNQLRTSKIAAARGKALTAVDPADRVIDNTPESKMLYKPMQQSDNGSLF